METRTLPKLAFCLLIVPLVCVAQAPKPELTSPLKELFSHKRHERALGQLKIGCTDCHRFSRKAEGSLLPGEKETPSSLPALNRLCHHCHLETVALPAPRQCEICHRNTAALRPGDHLLSWRSRHGAAASHDRDACARCHSPQSCTSCHVRVDLQKSRVHGPNFRLSHSIEARANPRSCTLCHTSPSFCTSCHLGGRR
jgi:hypothetical protein